MKERQNPPSEPKKPTVNPETQAEFAVSIDAIEYAKRTLVSTEIIKDPEKIFNKPGKSEFRITNRQNPVFIKGRQRVELSGDYYFAELSSDYGEEKEIVRLRLDHWSDDEIKTLHLQATSLNDELNLKALSEMVGGIKTSDLLTGQLSEVIKMREEVHFGKDATLPKYKVNSDGELVVYDRIVKAYVCVKHTTADPKLVELFEQAEKQLSKSEKATRLIYTGNLSARTKGEQKGLSSYTIVSRFEKNEHGEISFESDLPPDTPALIQRLIELEIDRVQIEEIVNGRFHNQVLKQVEVKNPNYLAEKEITLWNYFGPSSAVGGFNLKSQVTPLQTERFFGGGGPAFYKPVFTYQPAEDNDDDEKRLVNRLSFIVYSKGKLGSLAKNFDRKMAKNKHYSSKLVNNNIPSGDNNKDFRKAKSRIFKKKLSNSTTDQKIISIDKYRQTKTAKTYKQPEVNNSEPVIIRPVMIPIRPALPVAA